MLDSFLKGREQKAQEYLQKGLELIEDKFYKKVMIDIKRAMEMDTEFVYPKLMAMLEEYPRNGQEEASIAVGLNLLKENPNDFKLANKLGNFAREIKDYKQQIIFTSTQLK